MITNNPAQLKTILEDLEVEQLAIQTGFMLRQSRKITPALLICGFFRMMICGKYSLRIWAANLSQMNGSLISYQAIAKKLDFRQEPFFRALFQKALLAKIQSRLNFKVNSMLQSFRRVIVEDSTCFKLPKQLFEFFPGARLPHGRVAGGRLQLRIDLKQNTFDSFAIQSYCQNDMSFAHDILTTLQKDELIIRDLGYWAVPVFGQIIQKGAYFLSRLQLGTSVLNPDTQQSIDLVSCLKKNEHRGIKQVDIPVLLSEKHQVPVRLVAIKLTPQQAQKRRRMAKDQRHKNSLITEKAFYLMSWNLFVTNVNSTVWDVQSVYNAYSLRWNIEMIFKCWKSKFNFTSFFKNCYGRNPVKPEIILLLILIWLILVFIPRFNAVANVIWRQYKRIVSPMRYADFISTQMKFLGQLDVRKELATVAYFCCYDRRKDRLNHFEKTYINLLS